jgi:hypothetical protein
VAPAGQPWSGTGAARADLRLVHRGVGVPRASRCPGTTGRAFAPLAWSGWVGSFERSQSRSSLRRMSRRMAMRLGTGGPLRSGLLLRVDRERLVASQAIVLTLRHRGIPLTDHAQSGALLTTPRACASQTPQGALGRRHSCARASFGPIRSTDVGSFHQSWRVSGINDWTIGSALVNALEPDLACAG